MSDQFIYTTRKQLRERIVELESLLSEQRIANNSLKYMEDVHKEKVKLFQKKIEDLQKEVGQLQEKLDQYEGLSEEEKELRHKISVAQLQNELQSLNIERQKEVEDNFHKKPSKFD